MNKKVNSTTVKKAKPTKIGILLLQCYNKLFQCSNDVLVKYFPLKMKKERDDRRNNNTSVPFLKDFRKKPVIHKEPLTHGKWWI